MADRASTLQLVGGTLAGDVLHRLRTDIVSVTLKPGERLRFEALRALYGASFSTLREALACLVAEQLVVSEGQKGFRVAPVSKDDLMDLTYVRIMVEKEALSRSITAGDDYWEAKVLGDFHRMDRLEARLGDQYCLSPQWANVHSEFHHSLVAACGSPTLLDIRLKLFERARRYRRISSQFRVTVRGKDAEHRAILEAAIGRHATLATQLLELHIRQTTENVLKFASHLFEEDSEHG
jgi:GntR family transcriptional regulator, carbon starvation induced regulator